MVEERLGFEADGRGEHLLLLVEKVGSNTPWVARELARFCGVDARSVSYAGLKDRHALTRQVFSVHLPGKADPDFSTWPHLPAVRVLSAQRHSRKLQRGALRGNRFAIRIRDIHGDRTGLAARFEQVVGAGVPNYFGEQRFGIEDGNLVRARAMFAGTLGRVDRDQRGFYLSAARSFLFNEVLAGRVEAGTWNLGLAGEVWNLDGRGSIFGPEPMSAELESRCAQMDIHPTGPMWGAGELRSTDDVQAIELACAGQHSDLASGLAAAGLNQERRPLRLRIADASMLTADDGSVLFQFELPSGCFATTVLRELVDYSEQSGNTS